MFFQRIDDSRYDMIHSSLATVLWFHDGNVGKQPVAKNEYCAEYGLKEFQQYNWNNVENNTIQSINPN